MPAPTLPLAKFQHLLHYLDTVGIDASAVAAQAGLRFGELQGGAADRQVPAIHYSRLYKHAVVAMQQLHPHVPWGAGVGTEAFEMLCHTIIGCATLREALDRAARFSRVLEPVTGYHIDVRYDDDTVAVHYAWTASNITTLFAPRDWYRSAGARSVTLASGLLVWHGLLSWLVGHALRTEALMIAGEAVSDGYAEAIARSVSVRPQFDAPDNCLVFPASTLDWRIVQTDESLQGFLDLTVLELIEVEQRPASVSDAVKRLFGSDFSDGMPTFADIAGRLHTSESSLRRRLLEEETSFQALKDEVRCELAMQLLSDPDGRLGDIAERLGFTEQSSFGRSFRQWTGMSPKTWREWAQQHNTSHIAER